MAQPASGTELLLRSSQSAKYTWCVSFWIPLKANTTHFKQNSLGFHLSSVINKVLWQRHVGMCRKNIKEARNSVKVLRWASGWNELDKMSGCRHWLKFWYNEVLRGLFAFQNVGQLLNIQWEIKSNKLVSRKENFQIFIQLWETLLLQQIGLSKSIQNSRFHSEYGYILVTQKQTSKNMRFIFDCNFGTYRVSSRYVPARTCN
jgi:hypothetical protein